MNGLRNAPPNRIEEEEEEEGSMILEEEIDEDYEPTQEEIVEYAQFLGMDLEKDKEFFYIAREGLKAPLPEIWKPAKNRKGDIYYINIQTKKTQWEHPCDEYYKKLFQDVKKKKQESNSGVPKPATQSKFKSNLPLANNTLLSKPGPLPLIKEVGSQQRLDTNSSENQNTLSLNNPEFSLDTSPHNLQSKKLSEKSNPAQSQKLGSILNELKDDFSSPDDIAKIDKEYEERANAYRKEKEIEVKEMIVEQNEQKSDHEDTLRNKISRDLETFKVKLIERVKSSNKALAEDKEKINQNVILEFHSETEAAIKKINQDHTNAKRKLDLQEAREIDKAMEGEEERINKEYERNIMELAKTKKDLEKEQAKFYETREQKKRNLEQEIEDEKERIAEEYRRQLIDFEKKELANQRIEIDTHKNNVRIQMNEEKSALSVAENQRKSLALAKEAELKEEYDQRFDREKKQVDEEIAVRLKEYEEAEKAKKEKVVLLHYNNELKQEKDKKQLALQTELEKHRGNYRKRLDTYESQLKEKFDAEKQLTEQANNNTLEKHRNEVENIRTNISNKEDILFQIKKTQDKNDEVSREITELNRKSEQQKRENDQLQKKLETLKTKAKAQSKMNGITAIQDLEAKIQEATKKIKTLNLPQVNIIQAGYASPQQNNFQAGYTTPQQKLSKTLPVSATFPNTSFTKIMGDIEEIKSILVTKTDERERLNSSLTTSPNKYFSSRLTSPTGLKATLNDKNPLFNKSKINTHQEAYEKWMTTYEIESSYIAETREKIQECKNILTKRQSSLMQGQENFRRSLHEYKTALHKSPHKKNGLRQLKASLDEQVQKINQNIHELKEADIQIEMKERLLAALGHSIRRLHIGDVDAGQINNTYRRFLEVEVKIPNLAEEKNSKFYENWKDIVENQLTMNNDLSESDRSFDMKPSQTIPMEPNFASSVEFKPKDFQKRLEAFFSPKIPTKNMEYSYDNLVRVLDIQSKSEIMMPETLSFHRQVTEAQEERAKIKTVFSNHSEWLKDVKQKLNHRLYDKTTFEKTASSSSRSVFMSQNIMF